MTQVKPSYRGISVNNVDEFSILYQGFKEGFLKQTPLIGRVNGSFIKPGDVFIVSKSGRWNDGLSWDSGRTSRKGCCAQIVRYRQSDGNLVKRTKVFDDQWRIVAYGTNGGEAEDLMTTVELHASWNTTTAATADPPVADEEPSTLIDSEEPAGIVLDDDWVLADRNDSPSTSVPPDQYAPALTVTENHITTLQLFTGSQAVPRQPSLPNTESCVASLYQTAHKLQNTFGDVHSLIQSFIVDIGGRDQVLDGAGVRDGESFSFAFCITSYSGSPSIESFGYHIQKMIPNFGNSSRIQNAVWMLARLSRSRGLTWADSTLRWLREVEDPSLGDGEEFSPESPQDVIRYIKPGGSDYFLSTHHILEATFDALDPLRLTPRVVFNHIRIMKRAMEDMCEDWLLCLLGVLARLTLVEDQLTVVRVYEIYMLDLAILERDAAVASGYVVCPLTSLSYRSLTETATALISNVILSLRNSISQGDIGPRRVPTDEERTNIRLFGRSMSEWSLGPFLMSSEAHSSFQSVYYPRVTAMRTELAQCTWPVLIPNYLPSELAYFVSARRLQLSECHSRGIIPPEFELPFQERGPWVASDNRTWVIV